MAEQYSRQITFDSIPNFRDIGGYKTRGGDTVAWRRLFRSGDLRHMTQGDFQKLEEEIRLVTVIDLRSNFEIKNQGVGLISGTGIKYINISLISDGGDREANERRYRNFTNMGQFYVDLVRQKGFGKGIIEALAVIAKPENHPLIFHCSAGKDRTGILAAILLSVLDVADEDIKNDYCMSAAYIETIISRMKSEPEISEDVKSLPGYFWETVPESMALLLTTLRKEYGSINGYLESRHIEPSLIGQLESALLISTSSKG